MGDPVHIVYIFLYIIYTCYYFLLSPRVVEKHAHAKAPILHSRITQPLHTYLLYTLSMIQIYFYVLSIHTYIQCAPPACLSQQCTTTIYKYYIQYILYYTYLLTQYRRVVSVAVVAVAILLLPPVDVVAVRTGLCFERAHFGPLRPWPRLVYTILVVYCLLTVSGWADLGSYVLTKKLKTEYTLQVELS